MVEGLWRAIASPLQGESTYDIDKNRYTKQFPPMCWTCLELPETTLPPRAKRLIDEASNDGVKHSEYLIVCE